MFFCLFFETQTKDYLAYFKDKAVYVEEHILNWNPMKPLFYWILIPVQYAHIWEVLDHVETDFFTTRQHSH